MIFLALAVLVVVIHLARRWRLVRRGVRPGLENLDACPVCGTYDRYQIGRMPVIVEDAYGKLFRCSACRTFWYYDQVNGTSQRPDLNWIRKNWPDLGLED